MLNHFFLVKEYVNYRLRARSAHGVHSPFVFDFIETVLKDRRHFYAFDEIQQLREALYRNPKVLHVEDFGAGSLKGSKQQRVVKDIARTAGRTEKFGKLLFRLVDKYCFTRIIELGTSLGIGTSYLAKANAESRIVTLEGSAEIADTAAENFRQLALSQVRQVIGNFDETLVPVLRDMQPVDLLFVDGNHRKEPTLAYFREALPYLHEGSLLIFDDIHWSPGMRAAWDEICADPAVTLSIDLFNFGLVWFKKEFKIKQHFVLRY